MIVPRLAKRRCAAVLLVLLASFGAACGPDEQQVDAAREAFAQALAEGDRRGALDAVEALRALLPDDADSQLEIAGLLVGAGNAPEAVWALEQALRRYPTRDDLRLTLARVAVAVGNPSLALDALANVAPASEHHAAALAARAQAELHLGELETALETLAVAERLYPERNEARLLRISTLLSEHRNDEAERAIVEARAALASADDDDAAALELRRRLDIALAQIRAHAGEPDAAVLQLEAIISEAPADIVAWQALVSVLAQQGRAEQARERLATALAGEDPPLVLFPLAAQVDTRLGHDADAEALLRRYAAAAESPAAWVPLVEHLSNRGDAAATVAALEDAITRFPEPSPLYFLLTEARLARGDIEGARSGMNDFRTRTFGGDPQLDYLRARIELAEGDAEAAADQLEDLAPRLDRAATHFWLGRALEQTGDIEGARRRLGLAQQRHPRWSAPSAALVALEARRGEWRAMAHAAQLLVQRAPWSFEGWAALVDALAQLGDGEQAALVAEQVRERFPERADAQLLLAKALRAQGRYDEALDAIDAASGEVDTARIAERALTLGMAGRLPEGIALAKQRLATDHDSASLHAALAALLFAGRIEDEGVHATNRALALDPGEPRPLRVRCEFWASIGTWKGARGDCTRYLEARPGDAGAHFMLALALQQLGEADDALAAYRRAAELDDRDVRARNNLAGLLATQGDLEGALEAAQEAYRIDESNPFVMDTLGSLYLRRGLPKRAIFLLEQARAALPAQPDVALHLALAYRDAGRTDDARALLVELRSEAPEPMRAHVDEAIESLP